MRQHIMFLAKILGIGFAQIISHRFHVVEGLRERHAGFEMTDRLEDRAVITARVESVVPVHHVIVRDGNEEIGIGEQQGPVELGRRHAMTVKGCLFSFTIRPSTPRSSAKWLCQKA